jgi:hypothetical protein
MGPRLTTAPCNRHTLFRERLSDHGEPIAGSQYVLKDNEARRRRTPISYALEIRQKLRPEASGAGCQAGWRRDLGPCPGHAKKVLQKNRANFAAAREA